MDLALAKIEVSLAGSTIELFLFFFFDFGYGVLDASSRSIKEDCEYSPSPLELESINIRSDGNSYSSLI